MNGAQGTQAFPQGMPPGGIGQGMPPGGVGGPGGRMFLGGPFLGMGMTALMVVTLIVMAIAFWQFLHKAGFTPALALLMLVPLVNLGVALWLAFAEWPVTRELERMQLIVASSTATPAHAPVPTPRSADVELPATSFGAPDAPGA